MSVLPNDDALRHAGAADRPATAAVVAGPSAADAPSSAVDGRRADRSGGDGSAPVVTGERATLDDFQYQASSTGPLKKVIVCFKHGAKWYVDEVRDEGKCAGDESPASAAAVTGPSARDAGALHR